METMEILKYQQFCFVSFLIIKNEFYFSIVTI